MAKITLYPAGFRVSRCSAEDSPEHFEGGDGRCSMITIWQSYSQNDIRDRAAAMGDGDGATIEVGHCQVRIDAKQLIDRSGNIAGRDRVIDRVGGVLVGGAEDQTRLRAA